MKSKVYFTAAESSDDVGSVNRKLETLIEKSRLLDFIQAGYNVAIKIHFGEEGTDGFVRPEYVRVIRDAVVDKGASAFLSDANTLYRGKRLNSKDHLEIARKHGFTKETVGSDVVIPGNDKNQTADIRIGAKYIKTAKIARVYIDADAVLAVNHFKGHILTGFGGAIKNIGMGCATREGKLAQHCDVSPVFYADKCNGCGECQVVCPAGAIHLENKKAVLDKSKCIGCANCMAACSTSAMFIDMKSGVATQRKMAEYCLAALEGKKGKAGFINFALRINKECDCWSLENSRIAPDVGIFASLDPVAIDKATFELVNRTCGKDIFRAAHPDQDGTEQLKYGRDIGLGSLDYELIEL